MLKQIDRKKVRRRVRHRVRKKISGTGALPRVAVFRSLKHISVQAIDDATGRTIAAASTREKDLGVGYGGNIEAAKKVGSALAERMKEAGVSSALFDRGGFLYHGRVKALAEAVRENGIKI